MMNIALYLKEPARPTETTVYVSATLHGKRLKRSTGVKVKPSQWTGTKVRPFAQESESKNLKIENVVNLLKEIEREYLLKNMPLSKEILEKEFDGKISPVEIPQYKNLLGIYDEFVEARKLLRSDNTIKTYNTCKKHLKDFFNESGIEMVFENINMNFYDELLAYFIEKEYLNSTIGKYIAILKTFMFWASERGYHETKEYKRFSVFKSDSEKIKLTPEIIEKLRVTDFGEEYKNIVRDIFILSCYTGLRFIDIQNMREEDINEDYIRAHIQKTKEILEIPLLDIPKQIIKVHIERYGRLKVPTNQFCNREIKTLFKEIGFNDRVKFIQYSGGTAIVVEKDAYDYLTMHYGRIFFITNSILKGMNEEFIRKITGHKDYKSFKKYVQFSKEMVTESLLSAWER
ncbi:phage integrase SAM-like domain-containing protein [Elizabethkingia anophelis]|nr:phage integrase SAM-like domain-containing protein [Elizabethkingia anophelis]MDV3560785.1 hypothetical protein [Elizabethkingia anophelis]